MTAPTLPAWATILANGGLAVLALIPTSSLPWYVDALIAAGVGGLTYIAHLTTSKADTKKIADAALTGRVQ